MVHLFKNALNDGLDYNAGYKIRVHHTALLEPRRMLQLKVEIKGYPYSPGMEGCLDGGYYTFTYNVF